MAVKHGYLSIKNINIEFLKFPHPQYPHKDSKTEVELINKMYDAEVHGINGIPECDFRFAILYGDFINEVVVSERKEQRSEKLTKAEFEKLKKKLAKDCPNKEICVRCSIDKGDCWLLHGWKKEGDAYKHSYPLLGEYLPALKTVVLYVNNIDDVCGKPTYNGVIPTYIHELFHAYFHYVTEQKQTDYNYIREIEEAMTEFSTLVFLRMMKNEYSYEWCDIYEWAVNEIGKKQNTVGNLSAYGFGRYLFDSIPENEAFDWINKYAERLGYIDENDKLVQQYKKMVCPCYPTEPDKCLKLLRKILFETKNNPIKHRGNGFDENTQKRLGYYVYLLVDPNDENLFMLEKDRIIVCLITFNMLKRILKTTVINVIEYERLGQIMSSIILLLMDYQKTKHF